jgi:hypothetical protein
MINVTACFVVSSDSSEQLHLAKQQVADRVRPDSLYIDVTTAKDRVYVRHLRIGDYFDSVQIADSGPASFRVVFTTHPDADSYWKDIVVRILASIRSPGISIQPEKRSQDELLGTTG